MNILFVFENDLQKTQVTKKRHFQGKRRNSFWLNMEVERKETKTIVYKKLQYVNTAQD